MADRDNYFILTGVSFDPIETDEQKIKEAITKKQQEWSKDQNNPLKRNKAMENLRILKDIETVLLDPNQSQKEAEQAKRIRKMQYTKLEEKIKITEAKGYIKPRELESIVKKFKVYGISESDIKKRVTKPISKTKPTVIEQKEDLELIDQQMAANIEKNFKQLCGKNNTLYTFLRLNASASPAQLIEAAETKRKTLGSRVEKTGNLNAELELAGICLIVFKDRNSKKKYDNYVSITKYTELNEAIKEGAVNNKKEVNQELMETLLDMAVTKYGIRISDASAYIKQYCKMKGYIVAENSKINCGLCNTENAANAVTCSKCGKPLAIECPSCRTKNGNAAKKCGKCGFDLSKMNIAVDLITNAKKSISAKNLEEASKFIGEAKVYWPNHPDIVSIEKQISDEKQQFNILFSTIMSDVNAKNFYAAKTKIMQAKYNGFVIEQSIINKVESMITNIESGLEKAKKASGDDAFLQIVDLAKKINDSTEVNSLLKKFPPEPATNLVYKVKGSEVILEWKGSNSAGEIEYSIVRKKNSYANDEKDGDVIYTGAEVSFGDGTLTKSEEYYYTVFAKRHSIVSVGCKCNKPVVILPSLEGVRVVGGDGIVSLSWKAPRTINEVKIWKSNSEQRPESIEECENVVCNRVDGMNITNLENGKKQWFIIIAYHNINGTVYAAEPIVTNAVPQKPAKPLEDFSVVSRGVDYTAKWATSDWDVILFYSQKKPEFTVSAVYDIEELLKDYQKIDIQMKNMNEADFTLNFVGECYVIPGVINATNVILNIPCHLSNMPDVDQVSFDTNAAGNELYINFNWPKKFTKVAIVYRLDTYPEGANDPLGKYLECTKEQYYYDAAVLLQNPTKGIYYTTIYTVFESDSGKIYSSGVQTMINNEPQKDVCYSFKYKKGFLSKKNTLTLTIEADGNVVLPQFVLSSKFRAMPLTRDDGYIIASVTEETIINGNYTFKFKVESLQSDTCIKMFFVNDRHYKRYRLLNKGSSKI